MTAEPGTPPDPLDVARMASLRNWGEPPQATFDRMRKNATVDCGWGRVLFCQTFESAEDVARELRSERPGQRDLALYTRDPHVVLAFAPQELFLDPSHTFRLALDRYERTGQETGPFTVRPLRDGVDGETANRIYQGRHMVPAHPDFYWRVRQGGPVVVLVAEDDRSGHVVGVVTGIDHVAAFDDPDNGCSLWSLAVDPQCALPGVGDALVRALVERFIESGRAFLDLSVMHDNDQAIALYRKLGFEQVPVFCVKNKNEINEKLFMGPPPEAELNIYARIIVDEARRRGISVDILDAENGYFKLTLGGRSIVCRESLSELTTAVALSRCDDKAVTRRLLTQAGLRMPDQIAADDPERVKAFIETHERVVVKPARGEQGRGISVDLRTADEVETAIAEARKHGDKILIEEMVEGQDLRIIVIDGKVVAGAVRRPAQIQGDGRHTVRRLIEKQSRRRSQATGGESAIPLDAETERCVKLAGWSMEDVPDSGTPVAVRKTANLHTGGTIHDVTDLLHPRLIDAAARAAQALEIPVVGLDLLVPDVTKADYVFIEANERPGLANHEPQPTAERFVDLLFPQTRFTPPIS